MADEDLTKKLRSLAQLDRDAMSVYDDALKHVQSDTVRTQFTEFHDEHEHHLQVLSEKVTSMGGSDHEIGVDMMGRFADWATHFRSLGGEQDALRAMHTAEKYHNSRYSEAVGWDVSDPDLKATLQRFYDEEKRHLEFIESQLSAEKPVQTV